MTNAKYSFDVTYIIQESPPLQNNIENNLI